jgi:hypothetical protein
MQRAHAQLAPLRRQDIAGVRAALTPAQRTTFDANLAARKAQHEQRVASRQARHARRAHTKAAGA